MSLVVGQTATGGKSLLDRVLGRAVIEARPLAGGDICRAQLLTLDDGRHLFVKTRAGAPATMFTAEAAGLEWLAETETLRIPQVLAATPEFLALEYLESGPRRPNFDEELGRGLADLHRNPHDEWTEANFIGPLPQANPTYNDWCEFYYEYRLLPRVNEAIQAGTAPSSWRSKFERLAQRLPDLVPEEPLSRLHGDLWGGNLHTGPNGEPCLIDPAVYIGHREIDLAMMKLFGGFSAKVFASYHEAFPLLPGHEERVKLYQLYPLLVHVVLFGGGYVSSVEAALSRFI